MNWLEVSCDNGDVVIIHLEKVLYFIEDGKSAVKAVFSDTKHITMKVSFSSLIQQLKKIK